MSAVPHLLDDLVDVVMRVDAVPDTELVHLAVGDRAGVVLTRQQARDLGAALLRVSGRRGRADAGAARRAARGRH